MKSKNESHKEENKPTLVIGGNFFGHDTAIFAIDTRNKETFAIQTERLTRYKHDSLTPIPALNKLIEVNHVDIRSIRKVVFCQMSLNARDELFLEDRYEHEIALRKHFGAMYKKDVETARSNFDRLPTTQRIKSLLTSLSGWYLIYSSIAHRLGLMKEISGNALILKHLRTTFPRAEIEIRYFDHEFSHAVCALATSEFEKALVISIDGWGEKYFSRAFTFQNNSLVSLADSPTISTGIRISATQTIPYSIGSIYEYFTERLGFTPGADEGKVEALAAYGKPVEELLNKMLSSVDTDGSGSININAEAMGAALSLEQFETYLLRSSKEAMAATIQTFLETVMEKNVRILVERSGITNIALAGGVAANVINNLRIYEKIAANIHITPAMADDGAAQGAAYAYLLDIGWSITDIRSTIPQMPYLATSYARAEIHLELTRHKDKLTIEDLGFDWPERIAKLVTAGKIGALFHGKMEWGPRALGNRSIIADCRRKDFRDIINKEIKRRPSFQPFCPSMLAEEKDRLFESAYLNKHMTCAFRLKKEFWDLLPSAMHIDGTARVQFVEEKDNPNYFRLLKAVKADTGYGVVINTSFNKHGRTIVESPKDAVTDFLDTDMDYLLIEGYLVTRAVPKSSTA